MSTRAAIIANFDGNFHGIYCHSDGYPDHTGKTLKECYTSPELVKELIALGDLSFLDRRLNPTPGIGHKFGSREDDVTVAYGRDRGENGCEAVTGSTARAVANQIDHSYAYVWNDGAWTTYKHGEV